MPALHGLMENTRFPIHHFGVRDETVPAENDLVLGPILREPGVPGRGSFLSA